MPDGAKLELVRSLDLQDELKSEGAELGTGQFDDLLWEEVLDSAREDGNTRSFFVVTVTNGGIEEPVYMSPDWPSQEDAARRYVRSPMGLSDSELSGVSD